MNILTIDNHRAVVTYDPDTDMLRGEFLGLNGGADFYASDIHQPRASCPRGRNCRGRRDQSQPAHREGYRARSHDITSAP